MSRAKARQKPMEGAETQPAQDVAARQEDKASAAQQQETKKSKPVIPPKKHVTFPFISNHNHHSSRIHA